MADGTDALIDLAVESWRFSRLFARVLTRLDPPEAARHLNQLRYFQRRMDEALASADLSLVNLEGQPFDTGMAAEALNIADFGPDDLLEVEQMLEPVLMGPGGLRRSGTVILRKI